MLTYANDNSLKIKIEYEKLKANASLYSSTIEDSDERSTSTLRHAWSDYSLRKTANFFFFAQQEKQQTWEEIARSA